MTVLDRGMDVEPNLCHSLRGWPMGAPGGSLIDRGPSHCFEQVDKFRT
jgi:hypothetical protein